MKDIERPLFNGCKRYQEIRPADTIIYDLYIYIDNAPTANFRKLPSCQAGGKGARGTSRGRPVGAAGHGHAGIDHWTEEPKWVSSLVLVCRLEAIASNVDS